MQTKTFSIKQACKYGLNSVFNTTKLVVSIWIGVLIFYIIRSISYYILIYSCACHPLVYELLFMGGALISCWIHLGLMRIALALYDGTVWGFKSLFFDKNMGKLIFFYAITTLLYFFITIGGLLLLIIPGIIWALKYSFFDLILLDTQCGPIQALKKSGTLTYGAKWQLFQFYLCTAALILLSFIIIIGPLFTIPALYMSRVYIYRTLLNQEKTGMEDLPKWF